MDYSTEFQPKVMTTSDPQHLITVSLGKIARARSQRGGVSLHKNLLVASVLQRARTRYVMDGYITAFSRNSKQLITSNESDDSLGYSSDDEIDDDDDDDDDIPVIIGAYHSLTEKDQSVPDILQDWTESGMEEFNKENNPPSQDESVHETIDVKSEIHERLGLSTLDCGVNTNNSDSNTTENNNNNDLITHSDTETKNYVELSPVKSALKRRLSRQCYQEPAKRVRSNSSCDTKISYLDISSSVQTCTGSIIEPMQTEPTITSLVTIFNTGFNGLCNVRRDLPVSSCATESELDFNIPSFDLTIPMTPPIVLSV